LPQGRRAGDLIPPRIHALLIGDVVARLELILGGSARVAPHGGSADETGSAADCGSSPYVAGSSADRRSQSGTYNRADGGPARGALIGGLTW